MTQTRGVAAVVGTFDGVHRGHCFLLANLRAMARERGLSTRVYTFTDHPLVTIAPDRAPRMLDTLVEKTERLKSAGIDDVVVEPFTDVRSLTARQYIERIAAEGVRLLLVGHDNRFGCDGLRTLSQFVEAADGLGVEVMQAPELTDGDGATINSTQARQLIEHGDVAAAASVLGYYYTLAGTVVDGKHLGRTIGFPTANVSPHPHERKIIPGNGVYACEATVGGLTFPAMVNIGSRPTVNNDKEQVSIEAHLIGLNDNIYGRKITLRFLARLRDEQKFKSLEALCGQLERDRLEALGVYNSKRGK